MLQWIRSGPETGIHAACLGDEDIGHILLKCSNKEM